MSGPNLAKPATNAGTDRQQTEMEVLRDRLSAILDGAQNTTHRLENITCRLTGPQPVALPTDAGLRQDMDDPSGIIADIGMQIMHVEETLATARNWLEQLERLI